MPPENENISKSYYPSSDWINNEQPNPIKKLNNWPENTPDTAVDALPFFAKAVIDK